MYYLYCDRKHSSMRFIKLNSLLNTDVVCGIVTKYDDGLRGEKGEPGPVGPPGLPGEKGARGRRGKRVNKVLHIISLSY